MIEEKYVLKLFMESVAGARNRWQCRYGIAYEALTLQGDKQWREHPALKKKKKLYIVV